MVVSSSAVVAVGISALAWLVDLTVALAEVSVWHVELAWSNWSLWLWWSPDNASQVGEAFSSNASDSLVSSSAVSAVDVVAFAWLVCLSWVSASALLSWLHVKVAWNWSSAFWWNLPDNALLVRVALSVEASDNSGVSSAVLAENTVALAWLIVSSIALALVLVQVHVWSALVWSGDLWWDLALSWLWSVALSFVADNAVMSTTAVLAVGILANAWLVHGVVSAP